jgi:murein DD-endopeptidase MepM/ murein hydrolase activator NlpD
MSFVLALLLVFCPLGTVRTLAAPVRTQWIWPLTPVPAVVRAFTPPPLPWLPGHRGVDLAGTAGQPVRAAGAGVVAFAGVVAGTPVVSVDHASGLRTTYEPVTAVVRAGDVVAVGQPLGMLVAGHPGCPVLTCLHWGLRRGATYLNPLWLVRPYRVRLKPLTSTPSRVATAGPRRAGHSRRPCCRSEPTGAGSRVRPKPRPPPRSRGRPQSDCGARSLC